MKNTPIVIVVAMLLCGCVQTTFRTPDGFSFTTIRPAWTGSISEVDVSSPDFAVKLKGYNSDQARMAESIAAGVARGLAKP